MTYLYIGCEIRFFKWNADHHDVYSALVNSFTVDGRVNLTYYPNDTNANNVQCIEYYGLDLDGYDYWDIGAKPGLVEDSLPYTDDPLPGLGDFIWCWVYNSTESEHDVYSGYVRTIHPVFDEVNATVILADGDSANANALYPISAIDFETTTDDFWHLRIELESW